MTGPRHPAPEDPFLVGVNYWPRRKAMGWWKAFDRSEVADELDVIADIGLSVVRIFLLWEDFQPTPDRVSATAMGDLATVADLAADRGLGLDVTFFTGHMSGPNWAPPWLLGGDRPVPGGRQVVSGADVDAGPYRDPFIDPEAIEAGRLLVSTVAERLVGHPGLWAWNLGNEPDLFSLPPDPDAAPAWARTMVEAIRVHDERTPVTIGLHFDSLLTDNGLRVDRMFRDCDFGVMHAYPLYVELATGPTDPDLVPFAVALTASLAGTPVLAEELGGCTVPPGQPTQTWEWQALGRSWSQLMLSEEDLAEHLETVLPRLVEVGALGALLWCFADYHPDLWSSPPCDTKLHERHFGLVRPDGSLKPHAEVLRRFIASDPRVAEAPAWARLDIGGDAFYADPAAALPTLYETFRRRGMTSISSDDLRLVDVADASRYEIVAAGDADPVAFVDYAMRDETTVLLMHTEVRPDLEGRGIGTRTAKLVIDHVRDTGLKAIVGCPFITSWLRRHPDQQDILARPLRDPPSGA